MDEIRFQRKLLSMQDGPGLYDSPICLFAIQDRDSRQILHACLRKQANRTKFFHYPVWFGVKPCLRETLAEHGLPYAFISDGLVIRNSRNELRGIPAVIRAEHPKWVASLESFFARIQYEMRTDLTQENIDKYVEWWNRKKKEGTRKVSGEQPRPIPLTGDIGFPSKSARSW